MNCVDIRRYVDALVDGELSGADRGRVEAHVKQCPECRQWREMVRKARDVVKTRVVKSAAPAHLEDRIRSVISGKGRNVSGPMS
jgi:anti-sigma factor (TIGR02949 family)